MHYLDHAATTTLRPEAAAAYHDEALRTGNASSVHAAGRRARRALEEAREEVAALLGSDPVEVVFTSGGTEADNMAVVGVARARRRLGAGRVVVGGIEHHAVLDAAAALGDEGFAVGVIPVDRAGRVSADALTLDETTAVVSVMWANNETGVLQPLATVVDRARAVGVPVHTDAVQAVGHVPVDFHAAGVDLLSLSGHKFGAPVGIGALLMRRDVPLVPLSHGGGQERGLRSGTLNVPGAVALATALRLAVGEMVPEEKRLRGLRDALTDHLLACGGVHASGAGLPEAERLPSIAHVVIDDVDADALLFGLDRAGIAASSGSACRAGVQEASHVVLAMGYSVEQSRGGLRCSLGWSSTSADVAALADAIGPVISRARLAHRR